MRIALAMVAGTAMLLAGSPASAQFVCTTTPAEIACTNNGTAVGIANVATGANQNATTTNTGTAGGFSALTTGGGNATAINYGAVTATGFSAVATVGGNAVAINAGTDAVGFSAGATLGGNATGINTGSNNVIFTVTTQSGTATAVNSGSNTGSFSAHSFAGGNAVATNSGTNTAGFSALTSAGGDATATNSGTNTGNVSATTSTGGNATAGNSGTNNGSVLALATTTGNASASNAGTNTAGVVAQAQQGGSATVTNSGSNAGGLVAITIGGGNATIINSGVSSGLVNTQVIGGNGLVVNSGSITGEVFFLTAGGGTATLSNSGTISNFGGAAVQFNGLGPDTLNLLPGSTIIGGINLVGANDHVNFLGGNHNLTFNTLAGATVTGATPFAVSGNQAAAVDLTPFAMTPRSLGDFTRGVSDTVPVFFGSGAPGNGGPLAFAAPDASSRIDDVFATIPGLSAYSGEGMVFKAPTVVYADGSTIWARGFAGQRIQQQDGVLLRAVNLFYGGMIGGDWQTRPDLRLGAFLGGGKTRTSIDFNQGGNDSDLVFGGAYARYDIGQSFLHAAVQAGGSRNATSRTINNNLLVNGLETATASFNGWYVSPEATFGHRLALGKLADAAYTLTPSFRLRYLYGSYGGYTETGTTAPLTVGGQIVSTLEERGELKLTRSVTFAPSGMLSTSISGGVLGTQRVGGNTINAALLGQAIPFATPGQADVWGGFGGLGLEWRTGNVTLFSAAEYLALTDNSNIVSGRAGLRVAF